MKASLRWLEAMIGQSVGAEDAAGRLAMAGAPVESVTPLHQDLSGVVVGLVEAATRHPNADRLTLCTVVAGGEPVEVVCGAPNVEVGRKYPYAAVGITLPGGLKLERRKIRGVVSNGMLCSARELGLGTDHEGILAIDTNAAPGTPLLEALPIGDTQLEIDVTPNRPDLLCQKGVARELAASLGATVKLPTIPGGGRQGMAPERAERSGGVAGTEVVIEDTEGCARYVAAVVRGLRVGPSPAWLQARLTAIGQRPINNVVDATNYILHEINQPLHAFDLAKIGGGKIVVRRARPGERLVTLDGVERELSPEMMLICDAERPLAVAGVMGGLDSEVTDDTTDILLECAWFDPRRVRKGRQLLKLSTEASYRFERGMDLEGTGNAVRRSVELIIAVAGGEEAGAPVDVYPHPRKPATVFLRPERVEHLLGVPVPRAEVESLLGSVGFAVAPKEERLAVQVPGWRPDVTREVDLIEEVARLMGYDAFPTELRPYRPTNVPSDPAEKRAVAVREMFVGLGFHEARCLPLGPALGDQAVPLRNPLSAEETHLRVSLLHGLIRSVERNWAAHQRDVRLFEIGRIFELVKGAAVPAEQLRVAAVLSGARTPAHWTAGGKAEDFDLWDLRGMLEEAVRVAGAVGAVVARGSDGWVVRLADGMTAGSARRIVADRPAWAAPLFGFELMLDQAPRPVRPYRALPVTPSSARDLALLVPDGVVASDVEAAVRRSAGQLLESVTVFDEYRSADLGGRSVAWRLVFRHSERTLRDSEVDGAVGRVLEALKKEFGIERR